MKKKLLILLFLIQSAVMVLAQNTIPFYFSGGKLKLVTVLNKLNREQHLRIDFDQEDEVLQKEVNIAAGEYTFDSLFGRYLRSEGLEYKPNGDQIYVYVPNYRLSVQSNNSKKDSKISFSGYVTDAISGERLQGASISLHNRRRGATSDNHGFYSLKVLPGIIEVTVNYVGYQSIAQTIDISQDTVLHFKLAPVASSLSSVIIATIRNGSIQHNSQMSAIDMPIATIKAMPKLLGESDVLRALQFLPGIMAGNEGNSGLYVRGGSPDQNLILLDGVPVYNATHLFGLFSVFNTNALQSVQLYKGGFPGRYGGRLSSVVDIRMKDGNKNSWHGEGAIGLLSTNFTLEGPLSKGRSSLMISGRTTNWRPLMSLLSTTGADGRTKGKTVYGFYDLNAKANLYLRAQDHLYITAYMGRDKLNNNQTFANNIILSKLESGIKWGNAVGIIRWNHQFNKKVFSNTSLYYSRYQYGLLNNNRSTEQVVSESAEYHTHQTSTLQDLSLRYDMDIIPDIRNYIRVGASVTQHYFDPGTMENRKYNSNISMDTLIGGFKIAAKEFDSYIEDDIQLTSKLKANIGVHASAFHVEGKFYGSIQPRISSRYLINDRLSVKASFVTMNQYVHLLTNSGVGMPTDLWVPVTRRIPDEKSAQIALGMAYTSPQDIELTLEAYYKRLKNVVEYKEGSFFTNITTNWEDRVEVGKGDSKGVELMVQKKKGATTGFISYTLSYANRKFPTINYGKEFPYRYNRRHDLKLVVEHKFSENKELSFDWVFSTGQNITIPLQGYVDDAGNVNTVYSARNAYRMPLYHRADISMTFTRQKRKYERSWIIGLYNVYNRHNIFYITALHGTFRQVSLIPILPSVSWRIKF